MVKFDLGPPPSDILEKPNEEIVEEFIAALISAGASEKTAKVYRAAIMDFIDFIGNKPLREVTIDDVRKWRIDRLKNGFPRKRRHKKTKDPIEERRWRQATLHYYTLLIRGFFQWLGLKINVPVVRAPRRREVEALSEQEVQRLLDSIRDTLDLLIVGLLVETGLRAQEALELRWRDIDFNTGEIRVRAAKYGEERVVFFGSLTRYALTLWYYEKRPRTLDEKVLGISYSGLYKRLKTLAKIAGIDPRKVRPHVLRHTFATQALRKGMSLIAVQKLLGHRDVKITQVYTHLLREDIKRQYIQAFQLPIQAIQAPAFYPPSPQQVTPVQVPSQIQIPQTVEIGKQVVQASQYNKPSNPHINNNPVISNTLLPTNYVALETHQPNINMQGIQPQNPITPNGLVNNIGQQVNQVASVHNDVVHPLPSERTMKCPRCGSIIPLNARFCPYCGVKLR